MMDALVDLKGFQLSDLVVIFLVSMGLLLSLLRLWKGPSVADRIIAADTISVIVTATIVLMAFWFNSELYLDVALVYGVLAFVGVIALARMIEASPYKSDGGKND